MRKMSFRKARLLREAKAKAPDTDDLYINDDGELVNPATVTYDCGCINHGDDENVGCESCGHQSCLDCHQVNSQPASTSDWKCYEGYGCQAETNLVIQSLNQPQQGEEE